MNQQASIDKQKLFRVVREAIICATDKRTGISTVRLATEFNVNYHEIQAGLDQLVTDGSIVRVHNQQGSPIHEYSLPESVLSSKSLIITSKKGERGLSD
jgi:predicted ArsR family transcriptional regulator